MEIAPGIWNVPAGKVKHNESIEDAILRETKEETNLTIDEVKYIGYHFINSKHKRLVYTYYSKIADISDLKIDFLEFDEYQWSNALEVDLYDSLAPHLINHIKRLGKENENDNK